MATRTRRKARKQRGRLNSSSKRARSSASRKRRGGAPARRAPARRRPPRRPNLFVTFLKWAYVGIVNAPVEVWGLVVMFGAVLGGLGVYAGGAGPLGRGLEYLTRLFVGEVAVALPPVVFAGGAMLLAPVPRLHVGRIMAGSTLGLFAATGMIHLAEGNKPLYASLEKLSNIGGIFGAMAANPLSGLIGVWATWAVLGMLLVASLMIVTKTPLSRVVGWFHLALGHAVAFLRGLIAGQDDEGDSGEYYDDEEIPDDVYIEDDEEVMAPASRPRKGARSRDDGERPPSSLGAGRPTQMALVVGDSSSYKLPSLDLLAKGGDREVSARGIDDMSETLEATLQQFKVDASVTGHTAGPTVTRFEIELGEGVKVNRVLSLSNEIKYALASGELRFLAPIPGRSAIGIEVPNRSRQLVTLGDVLSSREAQADKHPLAVALGVDISGEPVLANLTEMPHLLIAGATNSGKSSCINSMITSVLARSRPDQVRMILIDPKRVELSNFAGVPHLLSPVVTVPKKAAAALNWVVKEMEMRYETLATNGMRNLEFYNDAVARGTVVKHDELEPDPEPLPYILVVVDELSDLMMVAPRDVESAICRIAQMARAVGIHLVLATQRPSVDVVTGLIKANIPSRLAFSVASQQDSRVVLDQGGADKLIGHGDMLFLHANSAKARRIQGAWVNEREVAAIVGHTRRQGQPIYIDGITSEDVTLGSSGGGVGGGGDDDDLLSEAMELVVRSQLGSTSMLQRKLKVGFARAGRLMDLLEQRGVVGPSHGSKPRDVLMTGEELNDSEEAGEA
ncbi:MAG: DNA translocase FtsK [Actinomycetota bacterium]|nr:DNA translocase FtsK [Actinomycetota bacterium]